MRQMRVSQSTMRVQKERELVTAKVWKAYVEQVCNSSCHYIFAMFQGLCKMLYIRLANILCFVWILWTPLYYVMNMSPSCCYFLLLFNFL